MNTYTSKINIFNLDINTSDEELQSICTGLLEQFYKKNDKICNNIDNNISDCDSDDNEINVDVLKKMVIKWIKLDDSIKEINKDIKEHKSEKSQLEEKILDYMNKTDKNEIPVKDGKIEKKKSEAKDPINEEHIKKCLIKSINDVQLVDKIATDIINNRMITEMYKLSRKSAKNIKPTKPRIKKN